MVQIITDKFNVNKHSKTLVQNNSLLKIYGEKKISKQKFPIDPHDPSLYHTKEMKPIFSCKYFVLVTELHTWQFGDRRSHSLIVLSRDPDRNVSSIGDMFSVTTLQQMHYTLLLVLSTSVVWITLKLQKKNNKSFGIGILIYTLTFSYDQGNIECTCCHEEKGIV